MKNSKKPRNNETIFSTPFILLGVWRSNAKVRAVTNSLLQFACVGLLLIFPFAWVFGNYESLLLTFRKSDDSEIKVLLTLFDLEILNNVLSN